MSLIPSGLSEAATLSLVGAQPIVFCVFLVKHFVSSLPVRVKEMVVTIPKAEIWSDVEATEDITTCKPWP